MEDELDNLRQKSTRTSTIYDDLETGGDASERGGNVLANLSPQQRFILAFLLFLNVIACGAGAIYLFVLR